MEFEVIKKQTEQKNITVEDYKSIALGWLQSMGLKLTPQHEQQFLDVCCAYGLNPIKKEIYAVEYTNKNTGEVTFNIIVAYDVYLKRAMKTGLLDGFETTIQGSGETMRAKCTIYRRDWSHPFVHEVYLQEYDQHNTMWRTKPITMLKKVAEAQAFRKCFPEDLGGIPYTSDELPENLTSVPPEKNITPQEQMKNTGMTTASQLPPPEPQFKGGPTTPEEAAIINRYVKAVYPNGARVFSNDELKLYSSYRIEKYTAQELITFIKNVALNRGVTLE